MLLAAAHLQPLGSIRGTGGGGLEAVVTDTAAMAPQQTPTHLFALVSTELTAQASTELTAQTSTELIDKQQPDHPSPCPHLTALPDKQVPASQSDFERPKWQQLQTCITVPFSRRLPGPAGGNTPTASLCYL